ncbi:MAG: PA2779 family protein [Thioalkalispiraceae bacterium]|jgi:hypothetical protein
MALFSKTKRIFVTLFVISFFSLGMQNVSVAAIVSSSDMVAAEQNQLNRDQLKTWMAREDVRQQLVDMGVDVDAAIDRVDSMTNVEVQQLSAKMDELPAGSGFVETAVLAFLVLVVLEVTGVTDILPNI